MKVAAVTAFAAAAAAAPVAEKRAAINDGVILNYALTLEHLEDKFYRDGVAKFSQKDFEKAGVTDPLFYSNLKEIAFDEKTHVSFLTTALKGAGVTPTAECTYNFGYKDAAGFLATAAILEGVGVSAYLGAAQYIANKAYLTAAGSILTVEARHSAYLRRNQSPAQSPFPAPFDIPLDFDEVYSLASLFITSCPATNPALPVKAFPALSVTSMGQVYQGSKITLKSAKKVDAKHAYFITAMGPVEAPLSGSGDSYTVTVPAGAQNGQEYLVLTCAPGAPTDDNIVAGPAVVEIATKDQKAGSHEQPWGYGNKGWWGNKDHKGHW